MFAVRKLDNVSTPADTRASKGRSAEIILLDSHRQDAAPDDNAYGVECAIVPNAWDHIGADMTHEAAVLARIERHRRDREALRRSLFGPAPQPPMGFFERLGVADGALQMSVLREVDKIDKRGADYVRDTLTGEGFGLSAEAVAQILAFVSVRSNGHDDALAKLDALGGGNATLEQGVAELREVLDEDDN
jgi:hypothetical protein